MGASGVVGTVGLITLNPPPIVPSWLEQTILVSPTQAKALNNLSASAIEILPASALGPNEYYDVQSAKGNLQFGGSDLAYLTGTGAFQFSYETSNNLFQVCFTAGVMLTGDIKGGASVITLTNTPITSLTPSSIIGKRIVLTNSNGTLYTQGTSWFKFSLIFRILSAK